jgi:hypothetical protein
MGHVSSLTVTPGHRPRPAGPRAPIPGLAGRTRLVSPSSPSARFMRLDRRAYSRCAWRLPACQLCPYGHTTNPGPAPERHRNARFAASRLWGGAPRLLAIV